MEIPNGTIIDTLLAYEDGELNWQETIELFSRLVKTGVAWQLQGSFGRQAKELIELGYLDAQGNNLNKE